MKNESARSHVVLSLSACVYVHWTHTHTNTHTHTHTHTHTNTQDWLRIYNSNPLVPNPDVLISGVDQVGTRQTGTRSGARAHAHASTHAQTHTQTHSRMHTCWHRCTQVRCTRHNGAIPCCPSPPWPRRLSRPSYRLTEVHTYLIMCVHLHMRPGLSSRSSFRACEQNTHIHTHTYIQTHKHAHTPLSLSLSLSLSLTHTHTHTHTVSQVNSDLAVSNSEDLKPGQPICLLLCSAMPVAK